MYDTEYEEMLIKKIIERILENPNLLLRKKKTSESKPKNYYQENEEFRERVKSKAREKIQCEKCKKYVSRANISKHVKSKQCQGNGEQDRPSIVKNEKCRFNRYSI